jgi:hypothetical protein
MLLFVAVVVIVFVFIKIRYVYMFFFSFDTEDGTFRTYFISSIDSKHLKVFNMIFFLQAKYHSTSLMLRLF